MHIDANQMTPAAGQGWGTTPAAGQELGATPSQSVRRNRFDDKLDGGLTPGWGAETPYESKVDMAEVKVDTTSSTKKRSR